MVFTALYLPATSSGEDPTKSGFLSEEAAEKHIARYLCPLCLEYLKNRFVTALHQGENGGLVEVVEEFFSPLDTMCGAEWAILTDEEYFEICKESDPSPDMTKNRPIPTRKIE